MSVVVDTSVWIEYFRGNVGPELDGLLNEGLVLLAPVVAAEILSAKLNRAQRRDVTALLSDLALHPTPSNHWFAVGEFRAELAKAGAAVSTPDAHVAQCALESDSALWSLDAVFERVAARSKLRLFAPGS